MKRRVEITVETERILLVRGRSVSVTAWCAGCDARVRMVTADEAARQVGSSARAVYRMVEAGLLHFLEGTETGLVVCLESLNNVAAGRTGPGGEKE